MLASSKTPGPQALLDLGLSLAEVAALLQVGRSTLWRYLKGNEAPERVALTVRAVTMLVAKVGRPAALARVRRVEVLFQMKHSKRPGSRVNFF